MASAVDETRPAAALQLLPDAATIHCALTRLLRKRAKKFVALASQMRADASPKTVHDLRVWSRRVQHAAGAFFPKPRAGKVRRLRRTPRQIRRVLSEWRNCDVLLEIVARQQRHTRSEAKRRAWIIVCDDLRRKRTKEVARAVEKLPRHDLAGYANLAHRVLGQSSEEAPEVILRRLCESVECAWTKWRSALVRAQETRAVEDLHGFRVATKQLRYRIELLYGVGHQDLKAQLRRLAGLQDALGVWHDREMLHHAVAGAIARGAVLLNETPAVRILLGELEKDRMRQTAAVEKVFHLASEQPVRQPIESGSANPALELEAKHTEVNP